MNDKLLIRKNILDSDLQKYLQLTSTSIMIKFTYLTGIAIAFLTHQLDFGSFIDVGILIMLSALVLGFSSFFFIKGTKEIKKISLEIRQMEKLILNA